MADIIQNSVPNPVMVYGRAPNGQLQAVTTDGSGNLSIAGVGTVPTALPTAGLLAEYRIAPTETVASLIDYSGNGNGAIGTAGTSPTIIASSGGIACGGAGAVILPAALNGAKTIVAYVGFQSAGLGTTANQSWQGIVAGNSGFATSLQWLLYSSTITDSFGNEIQGGFRFRTSKTSFTGYQSASNAAFNGNATLALVLNANDNFYINGTLISNTQNGTSVGAQSAGQLQLCGSSSYGYGNMNIYYAAFYSTALTTAQIAQASQVMAQNLSSRGISLSLGGSTTDITNQVTMIGDSLTAGVNWPVPLLANGPWNIADQGVGGYTTTNILNDAPYNSDGLYKSGSLNNVLTYWAGTNNPNNLPTIMANTRAFLQGRKQLGTKTIVGTMISRNTQDAMKDALNPLLRQYWPTFADGIVDFAANVHFGADGASANTTYYNVDGIHLTTFSDSYIIGPYFVNAINRVNGNTLEAGNYNRYTGTGFTVPTPLQTADTGCTGLSGASFTCTMPFNETAGNFIGVVEVCQTSANGITLNVPTDSRGNTYTAISAGQVFNSVAQIRGFFAPNIGAGANTITLTNTGTPGNCQVKVVEFSGIATANPLDVTSVIATGTSTTPASANVTTTQAGDLVLVIGGIGQQLGTPLTSTYWTAQSGATQLNTDPYAYISYYVAGAAGSQSGSATLAASNAWALQTAAFKAVASTTSTYQLQPVDIFATCVPSGSNGVGLNLPDGAWMAGRSITLTNEQTSGSATCVVNGTTPYATGVAQQIDGLNSITIPNGGTVELKSVLTFTGTAGVNQSPVVNWHQVGSNGIIGTNNNCSSSTSPAVCGSAASGSVAVPTGATPTLQINTTAVTASSQIYMTIDESLGTKLGVTCNSTLATLVQPVVTARTPGTSFTIQINATLAANPACVSYSIIN